MRPPKPFAAIRGLLVALPLLAAACTGTTTENAESGDDALSEPGSSSPAPETGMAVPAYADADIDEQAGKMRFRVGTGEIMEAESVDLSTDRKRGAYANVIAGAASTARGADFPIVELALVTRPGPGVVNHHPMKAGIYGCGRDAYVEVTVAAHEVKSSETPARQPWRRCTVSIDQSDVVTDPARPLYAARRIRGTFAAEVGNPGAEDPNPLVVRGAFAGYLVF